MKTSKPEMKKPQSRKGLFYYDDNSLRGQGSMAAVRLNAGRLFQTQSEEGTLLDICSCFVLSYHLVLAPVALYR